MEKEKNYRNYIIAVILIIVILLFFLLFNNFFGRRNALSDSVVKGVDNDVNKERYVSPSKLIDSLPMFDENVAKDLEPNVKEVVLNDVDIEEVAVGCGMTTLQQYCLEHILNGETPISEFVRVLGVVSD